MSSAGVVAFAGLEEAFPVFGQVDEELVVAVGVVSGTEAEAVLGAEFFGDLLVDVGERLFFSDGEDAAAGFVGDALENFLAVDALLVAAPLAATTAREAATSSATTTGEAAWKAAATPTSTAVVMGFFAAVVDGVDRGVGTLGGLDGGADGFFAAAVVAVGEQDQGFASLLLANDFVGGEENGVVEDGTGAVEASPATATATPATSLLLGLLVIWVVWVVWVVGVPTVELGTVGVAVDLLEAGL